VIRQQSPELRSTTIRLLVIPVVLYSAWMMEIFLLEGKMHLFSRFTPEGLFPYTIIACIITGMAAPFLCIRKAFISGAVNMFQIGFRSLRRTFTVCIITGCIGYGAITLFNPFGRDQHAFANAFLLLLPSVIASVMMCWVLAGTHVQAFVRSSGAFISSSVGIMMTTVLYSLTTFAYFPEILQQEAFFSSACLGIIAATFFFAVRDVYATCLVVALGSVFTLSARISPLYVNEMVPTVWISAALSLGALMGIHVYLSRNYITLKVPVQ